MSAEDLSHPADTPPLKLITTGGPFKQRWYRLAPDDNAAMRDEINPMLDTKIINVSCGPWGSPAFIVRTPGHRPRKVGDYRKVNSVLVPDVYPLPDMHAIFDSMGKAHYFGTSDLKSGFW